MAITIPNTFVAGTKIEAAPVNANFAEVANAVDKRGDTLTGNLSANAGVTVDGVDLSTIPNTAGTFNPLFPQVVIGTADTNGIRLDLESGTLAVREGDDSAYGPLTSGLLTTSGNHVPATNDGGALGTTSLSWADLFLASGGVINFNNGDVTITHSTNTLTFAGASSGYIFNDGNVGIGGTPGSVRLDLIGALNAIRVSDVTTDATTKQGKWLQRHYTNAEEDAMVAFTLSTSTDNLILIGGGSGAQNAATQISFYTAANNTVTTGTERMRIPAAGGVQCVTTLSVGNATPASTGAGITFPAAQSASSDANTLDDYEEGTWTGTLEGSTTNPTTPVQVTGQYTKIGRVVHVQINFVNVNTAGAAGNVTVTGLPFTIANLAGPVGAAYSAALNFNGGDALWAIGGAASTTVSFYTNGGVFNSLLHNGANGVYLYFSLTYFV